MILRESVLAFLDAADIMINEWQGKEENEYSRGYTQGYKDCITCLKSAIKL